MIYEANASSSACRLRRVHSVETGTPPKRRSHSRPAKGTGQGQERPASRDQEDSQRGAEAAEVNREPWMVNGEPQNGGSTADERRWTQIQMACARRRFHLRGESLNLAGALKATSLSAFICVHLRFSG